MLTNRRNGVVQLPLRFWSLALVLAVAGLGLSTQAASATLGYQISGASNPVHVYAGPGTNFPVVMVLTSGTPITIACQGYGPSTNHDRIWDQLDSGQWVSDYWVNTPQFNTFSPGIDRCDQMASWGQRELHALSWVAGQVGQTYQPGQTRPWACWCDHFVAEAFGMSASGYGNALGHYRDLRRRGQIHADLSPPPGALVFYNTSGGGHVVFSLGMDEIVTTPYTSDCSAGGVVYVTNLSHFGAYLGWAYANAEWPGR